MFFARLWEINYHISTDYYQDYIHFHKNKQKKISWLTFEFMEFRFRTSFTGELVENKKNLVATNLLGYT